MRFLIKLLFRLTGEKRQLLEIGYLFDRQKRTQAESRRRRWERGLARAYKNKAFLDFLFYQAEADKERIFRGRSKPDLARGARVRTLFIVHQMQLAELEEEKRKIKTVGGRKKLEALAKQLKVEYNRVTKI